MIKPIIPSTFHEVSPRDLHGDANVEIVQGILEAIQGIINKIDDSKLQGALRKILEKGKSLLATAQQFKGVRSSIQYRINDEEKDALLKEFAEILKTPEQKFSSIAKAPYSKLGEDTFEDVDHQVFAMEMKRLAVTLKEYLEYRVKERQEEKSDVYNEQFTLPDPGTNGNHNEFVKDSVLTQMTLQLAKLHRAVLRNHHHLLMLIGNFAGNAKNVEPQKEGNVTETADE